MWKDYRNNIEKEKGEEEERAPDGPCDRAWGGGEGGEVSMATWPWMVCIFFHIYIYIHVHTDMHLWGET